MRLIGLDIGTTGCKAAVFETDGRLIASASREYPVEIPHPNWAEQNAEAVWRLAQESIRQALIISGIKEVHAVGLSVQGEAVIPVDKDGNALRPAILGMDTRTGEQNAWLERRFGSEYLFQHTGMPVHTVNTCPKLLWIKQNEPEIWKSADRFLLYEDFLIKKMTGLAAISRCLASRTQLFDLVLDGWSPDILNALQLDPGKLAPIRPSGTVIGEMEAGLAERLGFANRPLVTTGGHDQACGALGAGLTRPGLCMVSTGTAEVLEVALSSPVVNEALAKAKDSVYAHVVPGIYLVMTLNHSGGLVLRWFRDTFCAEEKRMAAESGAEAQIEAYDLIFQNADLEPSPVLLMPHFAGKGTPGYDTASKGAILGMTFATTKTDIAKAILEGLTYEIRENLELLKSSGIDIHELRAIGGGSRSKLWLQLKADITGIKVVAPKISEAASWGAAILAGTGAGCLTSMQEASDRALELTKEYTPDPERQHRYDERYALYRQVYRAVTPIQHQME
jgi:xylulokinase